MATERTTTAQHRARARRRSSTRLPIARPLTTSTVLELQAARSYPSVSLLLTMTRPGPEIDRTDAARFDALVDEGLVRAYGWSTDDVEAARAFVGHPGCAAVQHGLSVLDTDDGAMLRLCEGAGLASVNRSPLGMGLLTGKFRRDARPAVSRLNELDAPGMIDFERVYRIVDVLTDVANARQVTPAQVALNWVMNKPGVDTEIIGARDEAPEQSGVSHFLEHLLFKGTADRSAQEISRAVDRVGGDINAFTSKEYTAFFCRLPARYAVEGIEIWNRSDCCAQRLSDYWVLVSDAPFTTDSLEEGVRRRG